MNLVEQHPTKQLSLIPSPPSIEPSGTEPYYTGQFDPLPLDQSNIVVQSPTTPGQLDMWKNADVPRSVYPSLSIEPSGTEPY